MTTALLAITITWLSITLMGVLPTVPDQRDATRVLIPLLCVVLVLFAHVIASLTP